MWDIQQTSTEGNNYAIKIEALKKAVAFLINGETIPQLLVTVIRYTLTCDNHTIHKLILLYLEIINITNSHGRLLPEMILFCEGLRRNLQSPNEFMRGVTLRFLSRINEFKIVEPLIPSILSNLKHRHPFVRRNAILAVMSVYKLPQGEQLLINAPEIIEKFLEAEQDPSCKRNAFLCCFLVLRIVLSNIFFLM
jgi:coatomer subunit beta